MKIVFECPAGGLNFLYIYFLYYFFSLNHFSLQITLQRSSGERARVQYGQFSVGDEMEKFKLALLRDFEDDSCAPIGDSMHGASFGSQGFGNSGIDHVALYDFTFIFKY